MYFKRSKFQKIINTTKHFWDADTFPEFKTNFQRTLEIANKAFTFYKCFFAIALLMHLIVPVWYREQIINCWLPFDRKLLEKSLKYLLITAFWQCITFGYTVWFSVIFSDCLFGLFLTSCILQYKLLQIGLKRLRAEGSIKNKKLKLISYIEYQKTLYT